MLDEGRRKIIIGISGGVSDAYQPAEEKYRVTQQVLETLYDFRMPVFVLTKSNLVLRDLDLFKEIHKQAFVNICFSITLHNEETKAIFEPKSSATWERFDALKQIRKAGLHGGVMAYPTIPCVGDTYENMQELAKDAKKAGAEFIMFAGMTLKPGRQKEYFFNVVRRRVPDAYPLIERIYANNHTYGHPIVELLPVNVMIQGRKICKEVGIADRSIRYMMPSEPKPNVRVLNTLFDLVYYQSMSLGRPRSSWQPYHSLAVLIEKGVENLDELRSKGLLGERLGVGLDMVEVLTKILETGSCQALSDVRNELDRLAENQPS
jgi:DNA repair photolyase